MWTTSSSRAERASIALAALLAGACARGGQGPPPEAPRDEVRAAAIPPPARPGARDRVLEIARARIVRASDAPELRERLRVEGALMVIDVQMREPLDLLRDAAASIVLNGRLLRDTVPIDAQRLAAAVPAAEVRGENRISVTYAGAEKTTTPAPPVVVRSP